MSMLDDPIKTTKLFILILVVLTCLYTSEAVLLNHSLTPVYATEHTTEVTTNINCENLSFFDAIGCKTANFFIGVADAITGVIGFLFFIQPNISFPFNAIFGLLSAILLIVASVLLFSLIHGILKLVRGGG